MTRRGFGSVRRLPSGRYQARYRGPDGQRRSSADTFLTKADAGRFLAGIETQMSKGQWLDPSGGALTLRSYSEAWLAQRTVKGRPLAPRTLQTYQHSLDMWILPELGKVRLSGLTPALVRTWHAKTLKATGPTATRQAYALLRAILNTAVSDDALHRNPCRISGAGQATSPERPLLDLETVVALVEAMPAHLQTLTFVTFWGHLRLGEVIALQRRDFDPTAGTLRIERQNVEIKGQGAVETTPKVGSQRTVHLPEQAVVALKEHLAQVAGLPTAPIFTRPDGAPLRSHNVDRAWHTARAKVGRSDAHFHDLRHAGLTLTAQLGATTAELMRRAGHSSARAAQIYQHAAASRDAEMAAKLTNAWGTSGARGGSSRA